MSIEVAKGLYESARAHALSGNLLYKAAIEEAVNDQHPDPAGFVFNGTYSLSILYLIALSLELYLKSAYVLHGGGADERSLRAIGHKLVDALDAVEMQGFRSEAPNLREIAVLMNEPFSQHYFRYARPNQMPLPDVPDVFQALQALNDELDPLIFPA